MKKKILNLTENVESKEAFDDAELPGVIENVETKDDMKVKDGNVKDGNIFDFLIFYRD